MLSDFYRGDSLEFEMNFKDKNGVPINITGAKIYFTLKEQPTDPDDKAKIQIMQSTHSDPVNGYTIFEVPASYTKNLKPLQSYYYDFQIVFANGKVKTITSGKVKVLQDITQIDT